MSDLSIYVWHQRKVIKVSVSKTLYPSRSALYRHMADRYKNCTAIWNGDFVRFNWLGIHDVRRGISKEFRTHLLLLGVGTS